MTDADVSARDTTRTAADGPAWYSNRFVQVVVLAALVVFVVLTVWTMAAAGDWRDRLAVYDGALAWLSFLIGALAGVSVTIPRINDFRQQASKAEKGREEADKDLARATGLTHELVASVEMVAQGVMIPLGGEESVGGVNPALASLRQKAQEVPRAA
ncbi:hypothetical protein [Micromonospora sp. NPDC005806]|uniref:hypothetical protein n=1 Tax=Micromonospora sp. NPDC005806 TaxID=3364234 RepID=UPI0036AD56A4